MRQIYFPEVYRPELGVRSSRRLLLATATLALAVFVGAWVGWRVGWSWLSGVDEATLAWPRGIGLAHPAWVTFWDAWCTVFSPAVFRVLTVALIGYAFWRRRVRVAVFLLLTVELSGALTEIVKQFADRPRPGTAFVDALSTSFPSGHALGDMAAVLALSVVLLPWVREGLRPWLLAAGVLIVVSVGLGRVALNVHHLSDVVAGWALGYAWFVACLAVLPRREAAITAETPAVPGIAR